MNITNDIVAAYIDTLYKSSSADLQNLRATAEQNHVPIILRDTENLLRLIVKLKKPARVLEIGTAVGFSSCVFAECCGCRVTTIEHEGETAAIAEANIRSLGFEDRIKVLRGEGTEVLKTLQESERDGGFQRFDMVFIDAAKSHYREFWNLSLPLLAEGGLIICDNVLQKGMTASDEFDTRRRYKTSIRRMREFIKYINSAEDFDTAVLPVGDGVSISISK
ncbi:MAG: O-methyltransferase [Bacillota bacterium]|nr:O-methyltransferase [Bacillota bacterium]